jgi:YebC/PmpR family DNA-binding regulatory protein
MAGHSKWSNIKRRKGAQDVKKGKTNTRLVKEVMVAAKAGGADKGMNAMLRLAVERANKANVTKDVIEKAILKATGQLSGQELFETSYEGYAAMGVAIWVQCMTDNKNRSVAEVRHAFSKFGGALGANGSVAYLFSRVAKIVIEGSDADAVFESVLDFDVECVESQDEGVLLIANYAELNGLCEHLSKKFNLLESELTYIATSEITLSSEDAAKVERLVDALEALDDVQSVYTNMVIE